MPRGANLGASTIDLHCHILPAIDDGARDLEDALGMARQAQADGVAAICATPHIRHDHDVRISELPDRLATVAQAIAHAGAAPRLLPGGEVAVSALHRLDDDELAAVSLGGGRRWILLEPPPGPLDDRLDRAVRQLQARGFDALIAHPERHAAPDLISRLDRLAGQGALIQATAAFLIDKPGRTGMLALAKAGLIHVLGSDSHSSRAGRPVALSAALMALSGVERLAPHSDWIAHTAPQAIVRGDPLTPPF